MNSTVICIGFVGLFTGLYLSDLCIEVTCLDIDEKKIEGIKNDIVPIYEPGLHDIVECNFTKGGLNLSTDLSEANQGSAAV